MYVIVINRDKDYDPIISQKMQKLNKRPILIPKKAIKDKSPESGGSSSDDGEHGRTSPKDKKHSFLKRRRQSEIEGSARRGKETNLGKYASDVESSGNMVKKY